MLRLAVLALAFLAGAKVWTQDTLFRSGAEEALVAAYRDRAIQACQKRQQNPAAEATAASPINWARSASIHMSTGSRNAAVHFWQVDHALRNARFRNPFLVLTAGDHAPGFTCEYDVLFGLAAVIRT